jgi:hypothetical protein
MKPLDQRVRDDFRPATPSLPPYVPPPHPSNHVLLVILVVAVVVVLAEGVVFAYVVTRAPFVPWSNQPTVTITDYSFDWSSPPSSLCAGWTSSQPLVPFAISAGAQFRLWWEFACWNNTGSYTIESIQSVTPGFVVVSSNLPVTVTSTNVSIFNVTLSAPNSSYSGALAIWILAHSN